jgi:hypothetical protein
MGVLLRLFRGVPDDVTGDAVDLFGCPYCGAGAGQPCQSNGRDAAVAHQLRLDLLTVDAEALLAPHWLVSYGPTAQPFTEQCVCHLGYDHDDTGAPAE